MLTLRVTLEAGHRLHEDGAAEIHVMQFFRALCQGFIQQTCLTRRPAVLDPVATPYRFHSFISRDALLAILSNMAIHVDESPAFPFRPRCVSGLSAVASAHSPVPWLRVRCTVGPESKLRSQVSCCLLYTSDAADDLTR